jgi:hypothetical protein
MPEVRRLRPKCPECGEIMKLSTDFETAIEYARYLLVNWRFPAKDGRQQFQHYHEVWVWADLITED